MNIENAVAIVSGGASGLGEATVERLLEGGAKVAIFDMNAERGNALASKYNGRAIFANVDVADEVSSVAGVAATIEAFGAVHICVNCAGIPDKIGRIVGKDGPMPGRRNTGGQRAVGFNARVSQAHGRAVRIRVAGRASRRQSLHQRRGHSDRRRHRSAATLMECIASRHSADLFRTEVIWVRRPTE